MRQIFGFAPEDVLRYSVSRSSAAHYEGSKEAEVRRRNLIGVTDERLDSG